MNIYFSSFHTEAYSEHNSPLRAKPLAVFIKKNRRQGKQQREEAEQSIAPAVAKRPVQTRPSQRQERTAHISQYIVSAQGGSSPFRAEQLDKVELGGHLAEISFYFIRTVMYEMELTRTK